VEGEVFGAGWSVTWLGRAGQRGRVEAAAAEVFAEVDRATSTWRPDSELATLRDGPVSDTLAAVLEEALAVARATDGAFDPTVRPLVELWRPGGVRRQTPPSDEELAAARARVGWTKVSLDPGQPRVVTLGGAALDLAGIAPGYAADRVSDALVLAGLRDHLVDVGGELRARGAAPGGGAWTVAVEGPDGPGGLATLQEAAIATSGNQHAGYQLDGQLVGHVIDPRTGWPSGLGVSAATVVAPRAAQADAWATALLVLGEAGLGRAEAAGVHAQLLVTTPAGLEARRTRRPPLSWGGR
jgi:thiamine biosynthesis lipoprotein